MARWTATAHLVAAHRQPLAVVAKSLYERGLPLLRSRRWPFGPLLRTPNSGAHQPLAVVANSLYERDLLFCCAAGDGPLGNRHLHSFSDPYIDS